MVCHQQNYVIIDSGRHARNRIEPSRSGVQAQKKRKKIDADLKDAKNKKQKFEVLVKQLCDEADSLSTDAETKNKCQSL